MPETTDTPPRRSREKAATRPRASGNPRSLHTRLETFFASFSLAFAAAGDEHCAKIIAEGSGPLAESWVNLANENAAVKRALERLMQGGAWGGVIFSTLAIVVPIGQHHGLVPAQFSMFGPSEVTPESTASNGTSPHGPNIPATPPPTGTVATAGEPASGAAPGESSGNEGTHGSGAGDVG